MTNLSLISVAKRFTVYTQRVGARFLLACVGICLLVGAVPVGADSTLYTDIPLRTKNRAKPNILFVVDNNGSRSQRTSSPDTWANLVAFATFAPSFSTNGVVSNISGSASTLAYFALPNALDSQDSTLTTYINNGPTQSDNDWKYRASGYWAGSGLSCANPATPVNEKYPGNGHTQVCSYQAKTADSSANMGCRAANCLDAFNALYYNPNTKYILPKTPEGKDMLLPASQYVASNGQTALQVAAANNCQCSDLGKCAWLDGFNPTAGCVDLTKNFSTAAYPPYPAQLQPFSANGAYPGGGPYVPTLGVSQLGTSGEATSWPMIQGMPGAGYNSNTARAILYYPQESANPYTSGPYAGQFAWKNPAGTFTVFCTVGLDCPPSPADVGSWAGPAVPMSPGCTLAGVSSGVSGAAPAWVTPAACVNAKVNNFDCTTGVVSSNYFSNTCRAACTIVGGTTCANPDKGLSCSSYSAEQCPSGCGVKGSIALDDFVCPVGTSRPQYVSSPYFCDAAGQGGGAYVANPCPTLSPTNTFKVYPNPGPADFYDPDGTRHVITNTTDQAYFYSGTADAGNKYSIWHSFYRTRLLALKSELNLAAFNAHLSDSFRVGLAALSNGGPPPNYHIDNLNWVVDNLVLDTVTSPGFGASTVASQNYFSAIADWSDIGITPPHKAEWFGQLAKIQPSKMPNLNMNDGLHGIYQWFVGRFPDPQVPDGYMTQQAANFSANLGADSQYIKVPDSHGNFVVTNRSGPMMYSCQANAVVLLATAPQAPTLTTPNFPYFSNNNGACTDPAGPNADSATNPCLLSFSKVYLPSYVSSFYDPVAYPTSKSGIAGVTINKTDSVWPYPFQASASSGNGNYGYIGNIMMGKKNGSFWQKYKANSLADLALYYWSHDLNEEFNAYGSSPLPVPVPIPDASGKLGVAPFGTDYAYWPHVTTNIISMVYEGRNNYSLPNTFLALNKGSALWPAPDPASWPNASSYVFDYAGNATTLSNAYGSLYGSVDDLAHAALNGHGKYLTANNGDQLGSALSTMFTDILALAGSESAVAVANTQVSPTGVSFAFQSSYNTSGWWGDIVASQISPVDGSIASFTLTPGTAASPFSCGPANAGLAGWSANCQLRNKLCTGYLPGNNCSDTPGAHQDTARQIVTNKPGNSSIGIPFTYTALNGAGLGAQLKFYATGSGTGTGFWLGFFSPFVNDEVQNVKSVINYLRGDASNENCTANSFGYRCRYRNGNTINEWNPLGDIVDAEAVVVGPPLTAYADAGYDAWRLSQAGRASVVFQAANDGMLHAFLVSSGVESWAYVPGFVLPNLKNLANPSYSHQYFVNATPVAGDAYFGSAWHTLLVGGLGKGGRGYYALDVSSPTAGTTETLTAQKVLWTFPNTNSSNAACSNTNVNMGYTYGRPQIVKMKVNNVTQWVVLVTSGYDNGANVSNTSDGQGHLYVLDAATGTCLKDFSTGVGSNASPSGLTYFAVQVVSPSTDVTAVKVYAGDLTGQVWKFAPASSDTNLSNWGVSLFAKLTDRDNNRAQPVTSEPNIAASGGTSLVFVGTGRYLGTTDAPSASNSKSLNDYVGQSMYALMDDGAMDYSTSARTAITSLQTSAHSTYVINADCTDSGGVVANSCLFNSSACTVQSSDARCFSGSLQTTLKSQTQIHPWVLDLPIGERIITSPMIAVGTLFFTSSQPVSDPCTPGGASFFYALDYLTGGTANGQTVVSQTIRDPITHDNVMASRPTLIQLPNGTVKGLVSTAVGSTIGVSFNVIQPGRRVSWRMVPN